MGSVRYKGSEKHKMHPLAFGLRISGGSKGDATLCDEHAGFTKDKVRTIPALIERDCKRAW